MTDRRRRILGWLAAGLAIVLLLGGVVWRVATSRNVVESVPLSTGQFNVRFLAADLGKLNYSSDDALRAFLRPRLPNTLVRKLGDVTTIRGFTMSKPEYGDLPLVLLFQLLSPQNAIQNNATNVFGGIEIPESTGFVFTKELNGYSSHGQGTLLHDLHAFPRRDPTIKFELFERDGLVLMRKSLPNPAYRTDFPVWSPETLPVTKPIDGARVTLKSLKIEQKWKRVEPVFEVETDDPSWLKPMYSENWTDATGNSGNWLSPFEPAWKLHLRLHRRRDAKFPASATWNVAGLAVPSQNPQGLEIKVEPPSAKTPDAEALKQVKLVDVDQSQTVDGIGLKVRYVAPAARIREENGKITVSPPGSPGNTGMSTSSGSTTDASGKLIRFSEVEVGMPYIRLEHDPLPAGVDLICDVRDENGVLLNGENLHPGMGGLNGVQFYAIYFAARPETKTLNLEVRVSRPRDLEFIVAPPEELRNAIKRKTATP